MTLIKILIGLLAFSTLLFSETTTVDPTDTEYIIHEYEEEKEYVPPTCYIFKKEGFDQTLKVPKDVIVAATILKDKRTIYSLDIRVALSKESANMTSYPKGFFYCERNTSGHYECLDTDPIGRMEVYLKNKDMYLHVDYAQLSFSGDATIQHIKSKEKTFMKGVKSPCYLSMETKIAVKDVKKGSKQEKLLQSIKIKDVIVDDLAYDENLAIAVARDNTPENRDKYYYTNRSEDHTYSVILKSVDGGKNWTKQEFKEIYPADKVLILDKNKIIISSEYGDYLGVSFDEGKSWSYSDFMGEVTSVNELDDKIIVTNNRDMVIESNDSGKSWHKKENSNIKEESVATLMNEDKASKSSEEGNTIAVLQIPRYKVNYETNTLIVQHLKTKCNCDKFSLPLTYNQANKRKGILGQYWSLGIETHITVQSKDTLVLFDALRGKEDHYIKSLKNENTFYYTSKKIEKTKDGYVRTTCNKSKEYFDKNGFLTKVKIKGHTYKIHYKDNKLVKVTDTFKGKSHLYYSFTYMYEGISVTYYNRDKPKTITFLKGAGGNLKSILEGNRQIFNYSYTSYEDDELLIEIQNIPKKDPYKMLLSIAYNENDVRVVTDYRRYEMGRIQEKEYVFENKGKERTYIITTLTKEFKDNILNNAYSSIDIYYFSYEDASRKHLLFTRFDEETFGFDKAGRVNAYSIQGKDIAIQYAPFSKMIHSTVTIWDEVSEYMYEYTNNPSHNLKKLITPEGNIELKYNEKDQIIEIISDKHHIIYEYLTMNKPTKMIIVGKGEVNITYDKNGEEKTIKTIPYSKNINAHKIALSITQAMQFLLHSVKLGSIKHYPNWIW